MVCTYHKQSINIYIVYLSIKVLEAYILMYISIITFVAMYILYHLDSQTIYVLC